MSVTTGRPTPAVVFTAFTGKIPTRLIAPGRKYAAEGGPTFKGGFALLRRAATIPAVEVLRLPDANIFNLIVGNAAAHGKNFSLHYEGSNTMLLPPLHDLMCTAVYSEVSPKLATKIGNASTREEATARNMGQIFDERATSSAAYPSGA